MKNNKKLLSLLLVLVLCFSTMVVSSLSVTGEEDGILAFEFKTSDYHPEYANNDATSVRAYNDGSMRMQSDSVNKQYQMMFEISDANAENLQNAVAESCEYYDGYLYIDIVVNSAYTIYGGNDCRPTVKVDFLSANKDGSPNYGGIVATTGENSIQSEDSARYLFNFSKFKEEEYNSESAPKYVYVLVQCYDWGCGGGLGTQPDVTFYPVYVYTGIDDGELKTVPTAPIDPNQKTFFEFNPGARKDYLNGPEEMKYSADGATWKSATFATEADYGYGRMSKSLNVCQQMQANFSFDRMGDETSNALNMANAEGGSGLLQVRITLESCKDEYGNDAIAEIDIQINTQAGTQDSEPDDIQVTAWQYPGTTRTYYLDVSKIVHKSQLGSITFRAQNYWYYDAKTNALFDWDKQSNYAGKDAAEALGHKQCRILPVMVISPVTVVQDASKTYSNTGYNLVLNDFNANGGKVPANITLKDPNMDGAVIDGGNGGNGNSNVNAGVTTVGVKPAKPTLSSAMLTGNKVAKISWNASTNAASTVTNYEVYRAIGSATAAYQKIATVSKTITSYTDSTVQYGKTYYYKVKAVNTSTKLSSDMSDAKVIKLVDLKSKPTVKITAAKKKAKIKLTKKIANATQYQVKYATNKKLKKAKTTTMKAKKTIKKLSSGKTYYVKVRAVTTINGKKVYGKWSKLAKVKVK